MKSAEEEYPFPSKEAKEMWNLLHEKYRTDKSIDLPEDMIKYEVPKY